jgi:hypothetical protein
VNPVDSEAVAAVLDSMKWSYRILDERTVLSGFRCNTPFYDYDAPFDIRCTKNWVYVRALLQKEVELRHANSVLSFLGQLNASCHGLRFLLVNGSVLAQIEIAVVHFSDSSLHEALSAVGRYCNHFGADISALATNRTIAELYEQIAVADRRMWSSAPIAIEAPDFEIVVNTLAE